MDFNGIDGVSIFSFSFDYRQQREMAEDQPNCIWCLTEMQQGGMAKRLIMNHVQIMLLIALTALSSSCSSTLHAGNVHSPDFLGEYRALLQPGQKDDILQAYKNPRTNWSAYNKILLKPITIEERFSSQLDTQQRRELYRLVGSFENMLHIKLSKHYELVEQPTTETMVIQMAIADAEDSQTKSALFSKALSQLEAISTIWTMEGGKPAFAGEITAEFTIHDAQTSELLAVGADRRIGGRKLFHNKVLSSWSDVQNSLEFWTNLTEYRLCVLRGESSCIEPQT
jgi:Protein of unknown function (DUF3313)